MCLLALFFRAVPDAAVVVGANREEVYARGGEPPALREGPGRFVAGLDPTAGGTWLGINAQGVLVAVTNRPRQSPPPRPRSRGLLTRDLLGCPTAAAAVELAVRELEQQRYAGCNFLCADASSAAVVHAGDWLRVLPLPPGIHVLTNGDVNSESDRRAVYSLHWLGGRPYQTRDDCLRALKELCAQTGNGGPAICLHGAQGGTVSSSLIALRPSLAESTYLHAQGPPDRTPYRDLSYLLRELAGSPSGKS